MYSYTLRQGLCSVHTNPLKADWRRREIELGRYVLVAVLDFSNASTQWLIPGTLCIGYSHAVRTYRAWCKNHTLKYYLLILLINLNLEHKNSYEVHWCSNLLHLGCMRPKREKVMTSLLKEVCSSAVADISEPRLCSLETEGLNASIWEALDDSLAWCWLQWCGVRAGRAATLTDAVMVHSSSDWPWRGRPTATSSAHCLLFPALRWCSGLWRDPHSLFSSDMIVRGRSLSPALQHSIILGLVCYQMTLHKYFSRKPRMRDDWWSVRPCDIDLSRLANCC